MLNIISSAIGHEKTAEENPRKKSLKAMLIDSVVIAALAAIPSYVLGSFNFEPVVYTFLLAFFVQLAAERGIKR